MFGIIDRYIGRQILISILLVTVVLTFIAALATFVDQMRYIGRGNIDFQFLLFYLLIQLPGIIYMVFPIVVLIGVVIGLGNLSRTSELIIIQSMGLSRFSVLKSACKTVIPLVILYFVVGEFVVPRLSQYADNQYQQATNIEGSSIQISHGTLWLREGDTFLVASSTLADGTLLRLVRYDFDKGNLKQTCYASKATWNQDHWIMSDVKCYSYTDNKISVRTADSESWNLLLNRDRVNVISVREDKLSISGLKDYIDYLEQNNLDASRYRLNMYLKVFSPLSVIVMILLGSLTVFGSFRSFSMGSRVVLGIAIGFGFYATNMLVAPFAIVYGVPPILAALLPTCLFGGLSIFILLRS